MACMTWDPIGRLYSAMTRQEKHLSPADLAVWTATKGNHKKRQKIRDLFISAGESLGATMHIYSIQEDRRCV
jgi:hypothetical protein